MEAINATPSWLGELPKVIAPTLVVHGTEDPILSYSHGAATADAIPGARLLTLEDVGHDLPRRVNDRVIGAILEHSGS